MKHLLSLVIFSAIFFSASAQSLNFSRVVNIAGDCITGTRLDTVPAGHVWKIESIRSEDVGINFSANGSSFIYQNYNSDTYMLIPPGVTGGNTVFQPIWLTSGAIIRTDCSTAFASDYYFYSILEFEVLP